MSHAHSIDFREYVQWEVPMQIEVLQRRQPVAGPRLSEIQIALRKGDRRDSFSGLCCKQLPILASMEQRGCVEVTLEARQTEVREKPFAAGRLRHGFADCSCKPPYERREPVKASFAFFDEIFLIAAEQLVASVAGQHDRDQLGCELGHHVSGYRRSVAERFVKMPDELVDNVERIRLKYRLMVIGSECFRDFACKRQLVIPFVAKPN